MAAVSKLEYLKRYMDEAGGGNQKKRLKKKRKVKKHNNIRIIDDAITFKHLDNNVNSDDESKFDLQEEKPILYAADGTTMITEEYEENERIKKSRWKNLDSNKINDNINNSNKISTKNIQRQKGFSPPRKLQRHDSSDSDMSPVRQKKACHSPSRKSQRHDSSDSDMSPVHQNRACQSPPRKSQRHDSSDSDISPIRQNRVRHDTSDSDASPVRHSNNSNRKGSHQDLSLIRRKRYDSDDDLSPKRVAKDSHRDHVSRDTDTVTKRKELIPEVLSTGKVGLNTAADLRKENEFKRHHLQQHMKTMDTSSSGKGAETVYRDKSGIKIDTALEAINKRKREEERLEHEEKYAKWGKGVAQGDSYKQKLKDDLQEIAKPLARYKDDKDLDVLLKEKDREGDPMLAYMAKKKTQTTAGKPRYNGPTPPPNRFNIWPGYRYDGVNRSNGFEKKRFMEMNKRKTVKDAAYKWSVEEM